MLNKNQIRTYWANRANSQGRKTTGFRGASAKQNEEQYQQRIFFLSRHVNFDLDTVDYGCGVGRYTEFFTGAYLGIDITPKLLGFARVDNPERDFLAITGSGVPTTVPARKFEQFFTATVLQHCNDSIVDEIFESVVRCETIVKFTLYENAKVKSNHMKGRSTDDYADLLSKHFKLKTVTHNSHEIVGAVHTLSQFEAYSR
jgi:SAM-dependent methyltransferase